MEPQNAGYEDITVLIPTLNEAETIERLITALRGRYPDINIVVVDDVSNDGTQDLVRAAGGRVALVERIGAVDRGITAAIVDGLEKVETKFFLVMDGDLQHPPEVAGELIAKLHGGADMVSGARLPYQENQGWHRIMMTRFATKIAKLHLRRRGWKVADPMSGFFGGKTALVRDAVRKHRERFEPKGYKIFFDIMRVIDPGIVFEQVHYQFGMRPGGHSKLRAAHAFYFLRSIFK